MGKNRKAKRKIKYQLLIMKSCFAGPEQEWCHTKVLLHIYRKELDHIHSFTIYLMQLC